MADWVKDRSLSNLAKGLDPAKGADVTHPVADMIRWNSASGKWEIYSGSAWGDLAATYNISVSTLGGTAASGYVKFTDDPVYQRAGVAEASLDTAVNTGFHPTTYAGHSRLMLVLNASGSTGPWQIEKHYGLNGVRWRSQTDSTTWTAWEYPVTTQTLQNNISGTVWHSGNDGTGSGLDADLVDGYNVAEAATVSTIAARNSSGYLFAVHFNQSSANSENPTVSQVMVTNGSDNYLRKATLAHLISQGSIVTLTGTQTLTNKTLTNPVATSQTLSAAAATIGAWDTNSGQIATVTLGTAGPYTMPAPTNLKVGTYILHVIQDATGGRLINTWNAVFKWPLGLGAPALSTAANARDVFSFVCDGTNLYGAQLKGY